MSSPDKQKGFTIVELIISILLLSVSVVGVYNAFSRMIIFTSGSYDRLTASYLAQEGIEVIRNIRDNYWLNLQNNADNETRSWAGEFTGCTYVPCEYEVDYASQGDYLTGESTIYPYVQGDTFITNGEGAISYTGTGGGDLEEKATKFSRKIVVSLVGDYILKVSSIVYWNNKGIAEQVQADTVLYDWY